tara:strand:- start:146 stop:472 length:327 start_codon:yes stop_codon:yes gene_type:complete
MPKFKLFISILIFTLLMIFTSIVKTQTRIIEKNIQKYKSKITQIQLNLYEAQLDFYYLSSPENITKQILRYSDDIYFPMDFSRIYLSLDQFTNQSRKITNNFLYEKKK